MKQILLTFGTMGAVAAPLATVVACNDRDYSKTLVTEEKVVEGFKSQVEEKITAGVIEEELIDVFMRADPDTYYSDANGWDLAQAKTHYVAANDNAARILAIHNIVHAYDADGLYSMDDHYGITHLSSKHGVDAKYFTSFTEFEKIAEHDDKENMYVAISAFSTKIKAIFTDITFTATDLPTYE